MLEQLSAAGVPKSSGTDPVTESDKQSLLGHLKASHGTAGGERKKITLVKKSTSEIKQADSTGRARTIQVEVRKKRTFIKRDDEAAVPEVVEEPVAAAPAIDTEELARREEDARRQAELLRRQEEEFNEKRQAREAEEARLAQAVVEQERAAAAAADAAEAAARAAAEAASPEGIAEAIAARTAKDAKAKTDSLERDSAARVIADRNAESKRADDLRAQDLVERRRKAEAEAANIRAMMSAPAKTMVAKKPEPAPVDPKAGIKGTLHKPAGTPGKPATTAAGAAAVGVAGKKEIKSENLSSTWKDDAAKKKEIKTRGDTSAGRSTNWRGGPRGRRDSRDSRDTGQSNFVAPTEVKVIEVHVPETITVAELAHKMSLKSSEVIKQLMKLGQMVTINQPLDQDTAMIVVE
ncbi:translation initiation factor IF-2 associated domain-containing protein, partial [Hydrogenophaga sp.]|uniref:translation initiation factor IF-2 associated domain-containing protein n=1 Tax=Hydrogenophaga sp. TaxID=1904254 RepID=UPI00261ABC82